MNWDWAVDMISSPSASLRLAGHVRLTGAYWSGRKERLPGARDVGIGVYEIAIVAQRLGELFCQCMHTPCGKLARSNRSEQPCLSTTVATYLVNQGCE